MEEAQQGGQTIEERLRDAEDVHKRLAALEELAKFGGIHEPRQSSFWEFKAIVDDVLGRITWRGFFMFLMGVELVTDGPNGAVEQLLEGALRTFGGGG